MIRTQLASVILAISLSGCTMAPKYTRPNAPVPETWSNGIANKSLNKQPEKSGKDVSEIKWRKYFLNTQLKKLVELALGKQPRSAGSSSQYRKDESASTRSNGPTYCLPSMPPEVALFNACLSVYLQPGSP